MKWRFSKSGPRAGETTKIAERVIADPMRVIVCSSEKHRQLYLKMGVPLKQTWVVTGADLEKHILKKMHKRAIL